MKRMDNKTPPGKERFEGITIGDELTGPNPKKIEYICNNCSQTLVTISDKTGNSDLFCRNCSIVFDPQDEQVRHRQKIMTPDKNIEPAVASIGTTPDVSIRHEPILKDGAAQLAKKGTIRFTHYYDSS